MLVDRLRHGGAMSFRALTADAGATVVVVARFLALLELFREGAVAFDQVTPLGELTVRWTGSEEGEIEVSDDFDTLDTTLDAELARDGRSRGGRMTEQTAPDGRPRRPTETAAADELAFDVDDLPGGALAALEAVLMVADEPIAGRPAGDGARAADRAGRGAARRARRRVPRRARRPAARVRGATRGGRLADLLGAGRTPTSSDGSCSRGRPPGSRRPRSRRSPSSPTGSP